MYIFLPTEISSWYKCIKEKRESVVESSKSLEPSLQQFDTVNATVSGSLRFDKGQREGRGGGGGEVGGRSHWSLRRILIARVLTSNER